MEEDWRGKNSQPKARLRRSKYSMLNKSVPVTKQIPKLKNGHRKKYNKNRTLRTYNTCCFDSVFQVCAALYTDYISFKSQIDNIADSEFCAMIKSACAESRKPLTQLNDLYVMRDKLMEDVVANADNTDVTDTGLTTIDCSSNVDYIVEHMWPQNLFSYTRMKWCKTCENTVTSNRCFIDLNLERFAKQNVLISDLNEHLNNSLNSEKTSKCPNKSCKSLLQIQTTLSDVIMVDLQMIRKQDTKRFSIDEAPAELELCGVELRIVALIEFILDDECLQQEGNQPVGHYVPHIKRISNVWENYDDVPNKVTDSNRTRKMEVHTMFYIKK